MDYKLYQKYNMPILQKYLILYYMLKISAYLMSDNERVQQIYIINAPIIDGVQCWHFSAQTTCYSSLVTIKIPRIDWMKCNTTFHISCFTSSLPWMLIKPDYLMPILLIQTFCQKSFLLEKKHLSLWSFFYFWHQWPVSIDNVPRISRLTI